MNGNNSRTISEFITSLSHPRKKELATILLNDETDNVVNIAKQAGFNETIIQEMAREIRQSVKEKEGFKIDFETGQILSSDQTADKTNEGDEQDNAQDTAQVDETSANDEQVDQTANETKNENNNDNQVPTEGTDPVDQAPTEPNPVASETPNSEVPKENTEQSTPDQTDQKPQ